MGREVEEVEISPGVGGRGLLPGERESRMCVS